MAAALAVAVALAEVAVAVAEVTVAAGEVAVAGVRQGEPADSRLGNGLPVTGASG